MALIQYKNPTGVLHIGEGRFFYAGEPQKVTAKERDELLKNYEDLEEVKEEKQSSKTKEEPIEEEQEELEDEGDIDA
ncbi:hypothetical protein [Bacillus sp. FSL R12-0069]|uniref:hypothetical protein n=1 Tax=Bacillus sp. FSL R12-0069 TaxID=2975342 RepID=UPI0030F724A8